MKPKTNHNRQCLVHVGAKTIYVEYADNRLRMVECTRVGDCVVSYDPKQVEIITSDDPRISDYAFFNRWTQDGLQEIATVVFYPHIKAN